MGISRRFSLAFVLPAVFALTSSACIWDKETLADEKRKSPQLAEAILGSASPPVAPEPLHARIAALKAQPRQDDPAWWNDLAGAYLRLGQAQEAVNLLEPVLGRFQTNYGVHANLGTAYHLLGRYQDAEREIARDLEINPEAHFGLEKYHLALLQYLVRDKAYQKTHLYVDEFTVAFNEEWDRLGLMPLIWVGADSPGQEPLPPYRLKWNLSTDTNLESGVIYLATLNPKEPACAVMLGVVALAKHSSSRDLNLALAAFEKAVRLQSPQSARLVAHQKLIREHINYARGQPFDRLRTSLLVGVLALTAFAAWRVVRRLRRKSAVREHSA